MFCKNGVSTVRRSAESVLNLDYPNIEYIVQDGASTDGTKEILESYGEKINLVSESDSGPQEAFFEAMRRCTGEIVGSCLVDEELLPNAARWAVDHLQQMPDAVAVYGDSHNTDLEGNIVGSYQPCHPLIIEKYLLHEVVPTFASSFFRRSAMEKAGLHERDWNMDCGEFEYWIQILLQGEVIYRPSFISKFSVHLGQLTHTPAAYEPLILARARIINQLFNDSAIVSRLSISKQQALAGLFLWSAQLSVDRGFYEEAEKYIYKAIPYGPPERRLQEFAGDCCNNALNALRKEKWDNAMKCLDCAELAGGGFPDIHLLRAMAFIGLEQKEKAKGALKVHLQRKPSDPAGLDLLADLKKG